MDFPKDVACIDVDTEYGNFKFFVWNGVRGREPVALLSQEFNPKQEVLVRIQSECLTGNVFHSRLCDCHAQTEEALKAIQDHGNGILIYQREEGRGAGLFKKALIYKYMQSGLDTYQASKAVTGSPDNRSYKEVPRMLARILDGHRPCIVLMTNNPEKISMLERAGYTVLVRNMAMDSTASNTGYVEAQRRYFSGQISTIGD
jgi:3,4-dihydroxy 2-butanone 4-phosphate synthase/GTP cyclohydrolase II